MATITQLAEVEVSKTFHLRFDGFVLAEHSSRPTDRFLVAFEEATLTLAATKSADGLWISKRSSLGEAPKLQLSVPGARLWDIRRGELSAKPAFTEYAIKGDHARVDVDKIRSSVPTWETMGVKDQIAMMVTTFWSSLEIENRSLLASRELEDVR